MRRKRVRKSTIMALVATCTAISAVAVFAPNTTKCTAYAEAPINISTQAELASISSNGNYVLTNDITLDTWAPIEFKGTLNGNGHTITTPAPLFSTLTQAEIKRLAITPSESFNFSITASVNQPTTFGLLACTATSSTITETYITGGNVSITTNTGSTIGGIVGKALNGTTISNTYTRMEVEVTQTTTSTEPLTHIIGSIAGEIIGANIHNTYTAPIGSDAITFNAPLTSENITIHIGGIAGKAQSSGYDKIINNFTGGNYNITAPENTTSKVGRILGTALGYNAQTLDCNSTYTPASTNLPYIADSSYEPTTLTTQLAQYFQTMAVYEPTHEPNIWNNENQTYMWDTARTWCKTANSTDFINLQMFEEFTIEISGINNGVGIKARVMELSGTEFVEATKTRFPYGAVVRIHLEIEDEFTHYKYISGLKRVGDSGTISNVTYNDENKKTAYYQFTVDGSTAGSFYGQTSNVQYKLKLQTSSPAEGTITYGRAGGTISSEPYILEYSKKEYSFYASPASNSYAFAGWQWVGVTENPTQGLPENRLVNIKFGMVDEDTSYTYITMPTEIPTTIDSDGAIVFTLQANFTTNVCNLELSCSLEEEGFDIYVSGVRIENIVDLNSFYNESIQVNKPLEIKIEMKEGYKFIRWEDASGRDINKVLGSGESADSQLIHLNVSGDFTLSIVIEPEEKITIDLTWLWFVLGGIGFAGLVVLVVFLIKNRKRKESFLQYY